jgi:4-diphosphocytidyl-2-C-methyl-D-erythritol kinase
MEAARVTGADVPVCVEARPRVMRGVGEILSAPVDLPRLPAVLVNPGVAVPTKDVFEALHRQPRQLPFPPPLPGEGWVAAAANDDSPALRGGMTELIAGLAADRNDLEAPAISLQPVIADVLAALRAVPGCRLARMSGSGATCFGLFDSGRTANTASKTLRERHADWWVRATTLG